MANSLFIFHCTTGPKFCQAQAGRVCSRRGGVRGWVQGVVEAFRPEEVVTDEAASYGEALEGGEVGPRHRLCAAHFRRNKRRRRTGWRTRMRGLLLELAEKARKVTGVTNNVTEGTIGRAFKVRVQSMRGFKKEANRDAFLNLAVLLDRARLRPVARLVV